MIDNKGDEYESILLEVKSEDLAQFKRLDQWLSHTLPYSRTFIKRLYAEGLIELSDTEEPAEHSVVLELKKMPPAGTHIQILLPPPIPSEAQAENIPLNILYEDEHLLFVHKEAGMVVHPAPGHYTGTLVNALLHHCPDLKGIGGVKRPGIVHRLDKGTSGVMVVAKTQDCHEKLVLLFSRHDLKRQYETLILPPAKGKVPWPHHGTLTSTIGRHPLHRQKMAANVAHGKEATTHYLVLKQYQELSHLELTLETGRTHQIRVHLSSLLKSPVLMDAQYGSPNDQLKRLPASMAKELELYPYPLLHAKHLGLKHPISKKYLEFTVAPPTIFSKVLELCHEN